jgi:hypothetical protein
MAASYQTEKPAPSWLVGQSDRFAGKKFELASPSLLLGRGDDCDVIVDDPQVSRHHVRLTWEAGDWIVEDLGSTNGTQVNGRQVSGGRQSLNPGGTLSVGGISFKLETTGLQDTVVAPHLRPEPAAPPLTVPVSSPPPAEPAPSAPAEKRTSSLWVTLGGAGLLILGLIGLMVVGAVAWLLLSPGAEPAEDLQVSIDSPANGSQVAEGNMLTIVAAAADEGGLDRLEIWIDEELAQVSPATTSSLAVNHPWIPRTPGSHVIIARAYNTAGQSNDAIVTVVVTAEVETSPSAVSEQPGTPSPTSDVVPPPTLTATSTPTAQPTYTPEPTYTPVSQPAPLGVFNDFETSTTWIRGDQPHGTFERTDALAHSGSYSGRLNYNFPTGGNDFVVFTWRRALDGQPNQLRAWVHGDGAGHYLNAWVKDNAGQTWQFTFGQVDHTGWEQMTALLDPGQPWPVGHITGPDNGLVDYPISFQALVLDDVPDAYSGSGTIYVDDLESAQGSAPAPPTPTSPPPTASPTASTSPSIDFRADKTDLEVWECTTLRWDVENVRAVYLDDRGVVGHGTREVCPNDTTTYTLRVVFHDGSTEDQTLTITLPDD